MNTLHDHVNPLVGSLNKFGSATIESLSLGEQPLNILNTMSQEGLLHGAVSLSITDSCHHLIVGKNVFVLLILIAKHVMLHFFSFIIRIFSALLSVFYSLADEGVYNGLLLFIKGVKHVLNGLLTFFVRHFFLLFLFFGLALIGM